jgi:hypothetical protein
MSDIHRVGGRPALALVQESAPETTSVSNVTFCGHCGAAPTAEVRAATRVCSSCELGLLLEASADAAPREGDAFLVLDSSLAICAVSAAAERLLVTCETDVVNRHVTELLVPADAEAHGRVNLAVAITWAARGDGATRRVTVRPTNTFGVRLTARIASCGPPRAALLVFD